MMLSPQMARAHADMWQEEKTRADAAEALVRELVAALQGVVAVADRKTTEFDAARIAIAKALGREAASPARASDEVPGKPSNLLSGERD